MDGNIEGYEMIINSPDDIFPEYLFNPLVNDFGDNYYEKGISNDPLIVKAKSLRRKYSNYFDYMDAINIYNEYIDLLIDKYGSWSIIKNNNKVGLLDDILPAKPKLKKNRKNKEFLRAGIVPSRTHQEAVDPNLDFVELSRKAFPDTYGKEIDEMESLKKPNKESRKMLRTMSDRISSQYRRRNLYSNVASNMGTDFIVEYFNQLSRGNYSEEGKYSERSIMEMYNEEMESRYSIPELVEDEILGNSPVLLNGRLVKKKDSRQIEILGEFLEQGIDLLGTKTKNMNRNAVKLLRNKYNAYDSTPMTKKELKKQKKRAKEERRRLEKRRDADSELNRILFKNKVSFHDKDDNSISFKLRDIYKD